MNNVLIIDDDEQLTEVLEEYLVKFGFTVSCAHAPSEGLKLLRSSAPDVLILDVMLPGRSGFDILRDLRAQDDTRDLPVMIVPFAPSQDYETAALFFISALNWAKERIWLSAPYFVPDDGVMNALELAALRGVDVRIITTGKPDSWAVYLAAFSYIDRLRETGIRFYAYEPGFLHEKVMLVDDKVSTVGTPNFDNRSFRLNFEVTAMVVDEAFAKEMEMMFEADFAHSRLIDPAIMDSKPFWWRLGVNRSRLAAPVL